MKQLIQIFVVLAITINSAIGQARYAVSDIADSLKKNADAVLRINNTSYKRVSANKYTKEVHYAVTILKPNAKRISELYVYYDRNSKVSDIKGFVYNKNGVLQYRIKKNDIGDYADNDDFTMFSDHRLKHYEPMVSSYPFTVEFMYTIEHTSVVGFDTWLPQEWFNISIESASLSFTVSKQFDISHKELNYNFRKKVTISNEVKVYTWSAENLKAIKYEYNIPNYLDFMPAVLLSPKEIAYEGTKGDFSTWESYGKWVYNLIKDRDELPDETVTHIKNLTDTIRNNKDKIKAIYKYMQNKTRYVNIALGIGGFQPILAKDVDTKGYGDCKALTNYTKALLKCIDIQSYYAEIGASRNQEIKFTNFASANQTNHVILCVPQENDTIWLECTNQKFPLGFLTTDAQNRYALLIKPTGGELVKTHSFETNENARISSIDLSINKKGEVDFEITTEYNNALYEDILFLINSSAKEQKEILLEDLAPSKRVEIENFSIEDASINDAQGKLYVKGEALSFITKAGKRIFVELEFFHENHFSNQISVERNLDIFEPFGYTYIDSMRISIPEGYSLEYIQNSTQFNSVYGHCKYDVKHKDNMITITRNLSINQGQYGRTMFDEINQFLRSISDFENKKIILVQND